MNTLYIVRHAQAEKGNQASSDEFRRLTAEGEREAHKVGLFLKSRNSNVNLIITSPAVRAHATAQRLAESLDCTLQIDRTLYTGNKLSILQQLTALPDTMKNVLVVGHYPTIVELHDYLAGNRQLGAMQTAELNGLSISVPWRELTEGIAVHEFTYQPTTS